MVDQAHLTFIRPSNDNPQDKATFDEAITVPDGITALGNGALVTRFSHRGRTTWVWHESDPMATYLATATNGRLALTQTRVGAIPVYNAVDPTLSAELGPLLDEVPDIVRFFSALYGPYPFNAAGAIVDDAPDVGYALESQTKPNFAFVPDETTLVHELAHQWFGDAVTLRQWPDIWLHEGFAEWSEWIWSERHGGPTAQDFFDDLVAENDPGTWDPPRPRDRCGRPVQRLGLRPRCHDAAGAARRGRRPHLLPHPARLVRPAPLRQRDDGGLHRPRPT